MDIRGGISTYGGTSFVGEPKISAGGDIYFGDALGAKEPTDKFTCLHYLRQTDPRDDKLRIEAEKGVPLPGSYEWILNDPNFEAWEQADSGVLWIRGGPGKGKTMIFIGLINELSQRVDQKPGEITISHFICESSDSLRNNSVAVLRGLLFMLLEQRTDLLKYVQEAFKAAGSRLFDENDKNLFFALKRLLLDILQDENLGSICFCVDALDECERGLAELIEVIRITNQNQGVHWGVTSRETPPILDRLASISLILDLETNYLRVNEAVELYINNSTRHFDEDFRADAAKILKERSEGTFLWVHLVCKRLAEVPEEDAFDELEQFPIGLDALYERMFEQIPKTSRTELALCHQILGIVLIAYRPMRLAEIVHSLEIPENLKRFSTRKSSPMEFMVEKTRKLIGQCGSFLSIQDGRVSTIHKSAEDFLRSYKRSELLFMGETRLHQQVGERLLGILSRRLRQDILQLEEPGVLNDEIPSEKRILLEDIDYAISFWANHTNNGGTEMLPGQDESESLALTFLKAHFLHWLEASSLMDSISYAFKQLELLKEHEAPGARGLIEEMVKFIRRYRIVIEEAPLQLYYGLRLFFPSEGELKDVINRDPVFMELRPRFETFDLQYLDDCLEVMECDDVISAESLIPGRDGKYLDMSSTMLALVGNNTVQLWNTSTGACRQVLRTLDRHDLFFSVKISPGEDKVVAGDTKRIFVWDVLFGVCERVLLNTQHYANIGSLTWCNYDSILQVATLSPAGISLWSMMSPERHGEEHLKLENINPMVISYPDDLASHLSHAQEAFESVLFSPEEFNRKPTIRIHFKNNNQFLLAYTYFRDGGDFSDELWVWESHRQQYRALELGRSESNFYWGLRSSSFSPNNARFFSTQNSSAVIYEVVHDEYRIWDITGDASVYLGNINVGSLHAITMTEYVPSCKLLIAIADHGDISFWSLGGSSPSLRISDHRRFIDIKVSPDSSKLASVVVANSRGLGTIRLWDLQSLIQKCARKNDPTFEKQTILTDRSPQVPQAPRWVTLSPCGRFVLTFYLNGIEILCLSTNQKTTIVPGDEIRAFKSAVCLGRYGDRDIMFSLSWSQIVQLWDIRTGECIQKLSGKSAGASAPPGAGGVNASRGSHDPAIQKSANSDIIGVAYMESYDVYDRDPENFYFANFVPSVILYRISTCQVGDPKLSHLWSLTSPIALSWKDTDMWDRIDIEKLEFSRNNKFLAFASKKKILVVDIVAQEFVQPHFQIYYRRIAGFSFSPDSQHIVVLHATNEAIKDGFSISLISISSGNLVNLLPPTNFYDLCRNPYGINGDSSVFPLSIITTNNHSYLHTGKIIFFVDEEAQNKPLDIRLLPRIFEFTSDSEWLLVNSTRLIWIPHHYRPYNDCWEAKENMIIIGSRSGTYVIQLDESILPMGLKRDWKFEDFEPFTPSTTMGEASAT